MVEENFEIRGSEMVQNEGFFRQFNKKKASPWLKKILKFEFLKGSRMNGSMVSGADMDK
jgi:hypothetical protein